MNKIIHRLWLGPAEMPLNYQAFGKAWQSLNPDWTVKEWTRAEIDQHTWQNQAIYEAIGMPQDGKQIDLVAAATQQADVLGYELVHKFGGLYVNTDMQPIRPLSALFDAHPEMATTDAVTMEDELWINNGAMWAPYAGSEFYGAVVDRLPYNYDPAKMMHLTTGPHLISAVVKSWIGPLVVLDRNVFNPVHYSSVKPGQDAEFKTLRLPPETIAVHHWGHKKNKRSHVVHLTSQ